MPRLLIIDDDDSVSGVEREILQLEGYEVDVASDGRLGFEKAVFNETYDLVLCDLKMPDWNGLDAIGSLDIIDNNVKFLVVSAFLGDEQYANELPRYKHVVGTLAKPFARKDLVDKVKECLDITI